MRKIAEHGWNVSRINGGLARCCYSAFIEDNFERRNRGNVK